ncbi:MAG: ATP-binding protein [Archangium sp.]|nr:ATP-binding protein [Archangium sp.]MDP3573663.1 ATP-binding protein [Archangium sp.]
MKPARDASIAQRLALGFTLIFVVMAGLGAAIARWTLHSTHGQEQLMTRVAPLGDAVGQLEARLLEVAIGVRAHLFNPTPERQRQHTLNVEEARQALLRLNSLPMDADVEAQVMTLRPQASSYLEDANRLVHDADPSAVVEKESALVASLERMLETLQTLGKLQRQKRTQTWEAMEAARRQAVEGTLVGVLVAVFTVRSIRGPARDLVALSELMEKGDWKPALAWASNGSERAKHDEMLKLGHAFGSAAVALERREQRLRADGKVAAATGSSLSKEVISHAALVAICEHVHAEVGALYWRDDQRLVPIATRAISETSAAVSLGEGIPWQAVREKRPILVRDIPPDSAFSVRFGYDHAPPRCVAAVPITVHGEVVGVLLVASLHELVAEQLTFLESASAQLGIGLQNVTAFEKIKNLLAELNGKSEQIQAQNEELQAQGEEIQAQNEDLKSATDQLREQAVILTDVDRRRAEFLGLLAHELRNPLAAVSNSLFALSNAGTNLAVRARAEQVIARQTRVLARLVEDLLDVTRISSGKIRLAREKIDLVEVVRECADDHRGAAEKAGVMLEVSLPPAPLWVEGDRSRLQQVMGNLLDNAFKFAGEKKQVSVTLAPGAAGWVELTVADQGIGIEPSVLERLFKPFSQADSSAAHHKSGLGLGLALVRSLIELHGGSVTAHSAGLGLGASFILRWPLLGTVAPVATSPRRQPRRVLIIEDNVDAATTLKQSMALHGHEVRVAHDAPEGLLAAREFSPDVLLCDIGLPSMDGYQVARRFREDEALKSVFLIAVSGHAAPEDQQRAAQAGFDRHFGKPPDIERLQKILDELQAT